MCWYVVSLTPDQRQRILDIYRGFLAKRLSEVEQLTLAGMTFNVLALRLSAAMLELDDTSELLRYRLSQRLERGSVTAFGTALQAIAKEVGGKGTGVEGADIMLERDGQHHYIQIKSGPQTFNKDIAQNIATQLNSARVRDPGSICHAGVCYGTLEQISPMVKAELQSRGVGLLVGTTFWEFVSGDANCMHELLGLAREAAEDTPAGEKSYARRVEDKLDELAEEFHHRYGHGLTDDAWQRFLADNS